MDCQEGLKSRTGKAQGGFTLIETVVALALLAVVLLGLASVTIMVVKGNFVSRAVTTASTLAHSRLEQMRNMAYANVGSGADTITADAVSYSRSWTVTEGSPGANMKTVEVIVTWNWDGTTRNVTMRSVVAR
jgi:prepilin-type N-terminal cleavage/methylation domain-containing protein